MIYLQQSPYINLCKYWWLLNDKFEYICKWLRFNPAFSWKDWSLILSHFHLSFIITHYPKILHNSVLCLTWSLIWILSKRFPSVCIPSAPNLCHTLSPSCSLKHHCSKNKGCSVQISQLSFIQYPVLLTSFFCSRNISTTVAEALKFLSCIRQVYVWNFCRNTRLSWLKCFVVFLRLSCHMPT